MQQIERFHSLQLAIENALLGFQAKLWTALPGIVQSYDATKGTCTVSPAVKAVMTTLAGVQYWVPIPLLVDIPVVYMGGGGFVATFPIQKDDEALVVFSARCIDGWWQNGGVQVQAEQRMHSLSDGFALIGPRSQANLIPNVSTDTAQLRSLDGSTYYELAGGQVANIVAPGGINITGPVSIDGDVSITGTVDADGDVSVTGAVTATKEGTFKTITVSTHTHGGVATGGGTSGPPIG